LTVECDSCTQMLYGNPKPSLLINGSCYYLVFKDQKDSPGNGRKYVIGTNRFDVNRVREYFWAG
jgi:hypothetical protein